MEDKKEKVAVPLKDDEHEKVSGGQVAGVRYQKECPTCHDDVFGMEIMGRISYYCSTCRKYI